MKKWLALILAVVMCLSFAACGGSSDSKEENNSVANNDEKVETTEDKASEVVAVIDSLGDISLDSKEKIDEAKKAYNALSSDEKSEVSNYNVLETAISNYEKLAKAEKEKALSAYKSNFDVDYDKVEGIYWYMPKNMPDYIDERCYIIPYIGVQDGKAWIGIRYNYTEDDWIFWETLTIVADGEKTVKYVGSMNTVRDNDGGVVWEWYDDMLNYNAPMDTEEIVMLQKIANSDETIIRFEGDEYYYDLTVSAKDKAMIKDVLEMYGAYVKY